MRDIEQQIAAWRQQMRAAGIRSPVLLDELENHLRDDVEQQQQQGGVSAQQAFETAVRRLGPAAELKTEFEIAQSNLNQPTETMKHQLLRRVLVCIAVLAIEVGFILPQVAAWRAHPDAMPSALGLAMLVIAALAVAWVAIKGSNAGLARLERQFPH